VRGTQEKIDIVERLRTQQGERLRIDAEHILKLKLANLHMIVCEQPVLSVIGACIEKWFVKKRSSWHVRVHNSREEF
jgi:hypothetical protein